MVTMKGQLTHFGHELEAKFVPIPDKIKEKVQELLRELHRIEEIPGIIRQGIVLLVYCAATYGFQKPSPRSAAILLRLLMCDEWRRP
jgi:hypothetical protein